MPDFFGFTYGFRLTINTFTAQNSPKTLHYKESPAENGNVKVSFLHLLSEPQKSAFDTGLKKLANCLQQKLLRKYTRDSPGGWGRRRQGRLRNDWLGNW